MVSFPITSWQINEETMETVRDFVFGGLQNHCRWWLQPWNQKMLAPWKNSYDQPKQHIKKQRRYFANKGPSSQGYGFSSSHVWMWELDYKENWELKNWCFWTVVLVDSWGSLGQQGDPISPSSRKLTVNIHWKDWCWSWSSDPLATWHKELTHLKRPWCWERLKAGGEGDDRGWDGWMASPSQWTWVCANSRTWWRTRKPGVLQSMGIAKGCTYMTEQNWTKTKKWSFMTQNPHCSYYHGASDGV